MVRDSSLVLKEAEVQLIAALVTRLIQWHESGIYWDLFYNYFKYSADYQHLSFVDHNMQISAGSYGDFLDGMNPILELAGRWNDDIGWWALATMTATEAFGKNAIVAKDNVMDGFNPTYFALTNNTLYEMFMNWDDQCGGGIYWSRTRDPKSEDPTLKSTITNVQAMSLSARLYAIERNADYKTKFDQLFQWLKTTGIIGSDYTVYDGVKTGSCGNVSTEIYSYHYGPLLSSLASIYTTTKTTTYLTEAHNLFDALTRQFIDASKVLSIEPSCPCDKSPTGYTFSIYGGLADLATATTNQTVRSAISDILKASAANNFKGCDANWYCMRNMAAGTNFTLKNGSSASGSSSASNGGGSSSVNVGAVVGGVVGGVAVLAIAGAIVYKVRGSRAAAAAKLGTGSGQLQSTEGFMTSPARP
ncbi:Six-hairpin glycosidase [Rhizoclosmatium globosum]|uniref:mannan endo-1,6-alpha-mannosidase n=1 Tax=Rhizoclosmatium globosum TaxID=329046 RepID=A0A1Y2CVT5_9FUNG|nr:Six-hairpin glycosidase [Rhizoclosmatium globosum]|eukprot:ORY50445.1 Six-hairpin glycosidase [Rhizoclosmatium globosum]